MYQAFISGYRLAEATHGKPYYVYTVEIVEPQSGTRYFIERRYSEFNALHRRLKKESDTAPFPPKRMRNSQPKVLEQRRAALELYVQKMLRLSSTKQHVLNFLGIDSRNAGVSTNRIHRETEIGDTNNPHPSTLGHHPVLIFQCDPYLRAESSNTSLPDIITNGVLLGVYKS